MKHKKTMLSVGTVASIIAPIAAVVSCGNDFGDKYEYYGSIQTITDAGSVADKSFNQSAFEAGQDYASIVKKDDKNVTFGFSQPKVTTTTMLQKAYESALKAGSRTLILPGFTHTAAGDAIHFAQRMHSKYPDARYICADGFADDKIFGKPDPAKPGDFLFKSGEAAANKSGFYNLGFNSQESGFLAAVYGGLFFNKVKNVSAPIKAWTFGGVAITFGVSSYMDGFLQGAKWFNSNKASTDQPIEMMFMEGNKPSISDFTGGFDPGMATSKVQTMINRGVQMILPVAGPQTGDVTGLIAANKMIGEVFAFGVDTDQSYVYKPETIMGSAVKGVYSGTSYALKALLEDGKTNAFSEFTYDMKPPAPTVDGRMPAKTTEPQNIYDVKKYLFGLRNELMATYEKQGSSHTDALAKANSRTLPTGFVPSHTSAIDLTQDPFYQRAEKIVAAESGFGKWGFGMPEYTAGYSYLRVAAEKGPK